MKKFSILMEYLQFLRSEKRYWIIPIVTLLLLLSIFVIVFEGSALAPFIYSLF